MTSANSNPNPATTATTDSGIPVESHEFSLTLGQSGRASCRERV